VRLSDNGKRVLAQVEACVLTPYKDGKYYSIGFGHNGPEVEAMGPITVQKAFEMLEEDLKPREQRVNDLVKKPITQEQFDALVLLHYQSGNRYLPAVAALINAGEVEVLEKLWPMMAYDADNNLSRGLEIRRGREREIHFRGDYGPVDAPIKVWRGNPRKTQPLSYHIKESDLASQ
jgi:GH24 family phage-related lysozyme (muramidase)